MASRKLVIFILFLTICVRGKAVTLSTFEDLSLSAESYWSGTYPSDGTGGTYGLVTFTSGVASFNNYSDGDWSAWHGWAYSNTTDTTTGDFTNQYSAFPGSGVDSSSNYGVCYDSRNTSSFGDWPTLDLTGSASVIAGAYITNTTYGALAMQNGSGFNKQFGGVSSDDPDWYKLTITGLDDVGSTTSTVDFYLADFRFANNANDYILDQWTWVDFTSLGTVDSLRFSVSSSDDSGGFGINNPAYFAMDNLTIPEPLTVVFLSLGGLLLRRV